MNGMTLIQEYASTAVRSMASQASAVSQLEHGPSKGRFREIFVQTVLSQFLTDQFGIGSGIVINQQGEQSSEQDVIIFDRGILPPFIASGTLGVFPVEAVLATVEVKSRLKSDTIQSAESSAKRLHRIYRHGSLYEDCSKTERPLTAILGFQSAGCGCDHIAEDRAKIWLQDFNSLFGICVVGRYSWLRLNGWQPLEGDELHFEETKRFVATLLDNVRTKSERRHALFASKHRDWLSIYTRWNCSGAAALRGGSAPPSPSEDD